MGNEAFYIEEEDIVFESFTEEPEIEILDESYAESDKFIYRECCEMSLHEDAILKSACMPERMVTVDIERLRKMGVPEYVIDMILESEEALSTLRVTRTGRIVLPEYKIEIKMPPLDKALYFLYLRHPEGIRFKELSDYRDELMDLYSSITGRDDMEDIAASIDSLIDPLSNSVNEKCSRIKRAFTKAFSPELAKNYYIDGKSGEPKSIALDRDLVSWETLRG